MGAHLELVNKFSFHHRIKVMFMTNGLPKCLSSDKLAWLPKVSTGKVRYDRSPPMNYNELK